MCRTGLALSLACLGAWAQAQSTPAVTLSPPRTGEPSPGLPDTPASQAAPGGATSDSRQTDPTGNPSARGQVAIQAKAIESVRTLLTAKRTGEALRVVERSLREYPDNTQLRFLHGIALTDSNQTEQAIGVFSALTRDHPELAEPYNNLAVLHAGSGNLLAAREALEQAVIAVPGYALAHENLGDLYLRLAMQTYERATQSPATTASARRKLVLARDVLEQLSLTPARR